MYLLYYFVSGVNSGAIIINGGLVNMEDVSFTSNVISPVIGFPNLRHNIFLTDGAVLNVTRINVDTGDSKFIYISEGSGARVVGVDV
jgi:hypothetical protein